MEGQGGDSLRKFSHVVREPPSGSAPGFALGFETELWEKAAGNPALSPGSLSASCCQSACCRYAGGLRAVWAGAT